MTRPMVPELRVGTVTAQGTTTVDVDVESSGVDVPMGWACDGQPVIGDVVSVLWAFGTGVVLGPLSIDVWHTVGGPGEPAYTGSWGQVSGTRPLGFRRIGDRVELCGASGTSAGSTTGSSVFTLPVGYRPDTNIRFTITGNVFGTNTNTGLTVFINGPGGSFGIVQIINFTGTVQWGAVGFEGLSFPLIGAV